MVKKRQAVAEETPIKSHECPQAHLLKTKNKKAGISPPRNRKEEKPRPAKLPPANGGYMEKSEIVTTESGEQYFIMGKNRIKITEHFPANGKPIEELITDLIAHKIKEKAEKTP